MKKIIAASAITFMPVIAYAQAVPALQPTNYENMGVISNTSAELSMDEQYALSLAEQWRRAPNKAIIDQYGFVKFAYGANMPTLICKPLTVCDIALEPGEIITDIHIGDSVRWQASTSLSGSKKGDISHVIIKPTDSGLTTNMFIATDRRTYNLNLKSDNRQYIPHLSFLYPQDMNNILSSYHTRVAQRKQEQQISAPELGNVDIASLDFDFSISGSAPWRPTRVFTDGMKTYIQFPRSLGVSEAPILVALNGRSQELVNYRVKGDTYIVDRVNTKFALLSGVGMKQDRITITPR